MIRRADEHDNADLLALTRQLSLPGLVRFGADRSPDFFALDRQLAGDPLVLITETDHRAVGFVDACRLAARVHERVVPAAMLTLAGMDADHRGRGIFLELVRELESRLRASGCALAIGVANAGNRAVREFVRIWPHGAVFGEAIELHVLIHARIPHVIAGVSMRPAQDGDLPRIDELMRSHRDAYHVALDVPRIAQKRYAGLNASDFLVAENADGRIVASLALWDQHGWRRTPVLDYGPSIAMLRHAFDGLRWLTHRPRLPSRGEPFRFAHVAFPAAERGAEHVFGELLRHAMRDLARRELHFLALGLPSSDPLLPTLRGFLKLSMRASPFLAAGSDEVRRDLLRSLPPRCWLDYPLT